MLTSYNGVNVLKFAISLSPGYLSSWRGVVCVVWSWEEPRDEALLHQWPRQLPLHRGGGDVHPSQRTRREACRWGQRSVRVGVVTLSLLISISFVHYLCTPADNFSRTHPPKEFSSTWLSMMSRRTWVAPICLCTLRGVMCFIYRRLTNNWFSFVKIRKRIRINACTVHRFC